MNRLIKITFVNKPNNKKFAQYIKAATIEEAIKVRETFFECEVLEIHSVSIVAECVLNSEGSTISGWKLPD